MSNKLYYTEDEPDSNCKALKFFYVFGLAVAYGRWSFTRGGRTWRFDCIPKSTLGPLYPLLPLDESYLIIIPRARMGSESIAHE